ncbi:unnamed protein product [Mytilus coruscus]|uniref:Integrase zinc-binding domain-containing protein n=1 Tax=Mytilus coruscus TaxID=42192 RepID=A0A6J8AWV4_MYTCO|nr:unnamed protein product [Mytilus coruscus]
MFLQSYDYEIIHKKGTANGNADALSRRPYGTEIVTITTATVESSTRTEATFIELDPYASICEISPKEKIVNDQRTHENFKDVIKYILDKELPDKTRQARKTVIESQNYILDDDEYHISPRIVKENSIEAQQKYKAQHDKNAREATFRIRDKVWMDLKTMPVGYSRKLCNKWQGPYYITEVTSRNTYKLRRCSDDVPIKGPVNANSLKQYHDPQDRPTNNVDVPTDDEMSDDEDNEEENAQDAEKIVQTDTQPENQVQRHTDNIRTNDDPEENIPPELRHDFKVRKDQTKRIKARKTKRYK